MAQNSYSNPTPFKRGATFDYSGPVTLLDNGVAVSDLGDWTGHCEMKTIDGADIATLTVEWLDEIEGIIRIRSVASTAGWPVGRAHLDVLFVGPLGQIITTTTVNFIIEAGVTGVPA